jgi:hypothetical protein
VESEVERQLRREVTRLRTEIGGLRTELAESKRVREEIYERWVSLERRAAELRTEVSKLLADWRKFACPKQLGDPRE